MNTKRFWALFGLLASLALGAGCRKLMEDKPQAKGLVLVTPSAEQKGMNATALIETEAVLIKSRSVLLRALQRIGELRAEQPDQQTPKVQALAKNIVAKQVGQSLAMQVRVFDPDPQRATLLCNALIEAWIEYHLEQGHSASAAKIDWLAKQVDGLVARLDSLPTAGQGKQEGAQQDRIELEEKIALVNNRIMQMQLDRSLDNTGARVIERCRPVRPE